MLVPSEDGDQDLTFAYDSDGVPLTVRWDGSYYYYVTNIQGDVIGITDSTGLEVVAYTYDAWGNPLSTTGTMATTLGTYNPLRYRGYVWDAETNLYYLQSRYYNPEIGRFISADELVSTGQGIAGFNMFAYCLNNPINFKDQDGKTSESAVLGWMSSMWWLAAIDGPLPIGDIVFNAGILLLTIEVICTIHTYEGITYYSPHSKNKSEIKRNTHEEGESRRKRDQGGEKKKKKKDWIPNPNKRNNTDQANGRTGVWRIDRLM